MPTLRQSILPSSRPGARGRTRTIASRKPIRLREVRAGYNRGGFTFLDVSIAQTALHEARVRFVDALAEYHQAKVDYDRLTGRFIELVGGY